MAVQLEGPLTGHLLLALPEPDAASAGRAASATPCRPAAGWSGLAESALLESGNIVGSAFVSAVAVLVGREAAPLGAAASRAGAAASLRRCARGPDAGSVALATRFSCAEPPGPLEGLILVMPDPERIAPLLTALDVG